jgi:hypothetical protein
MLYSETQLSAGFVSLPLYFINPNPIFTYNVLTILSFLLAGWCMYLLAKRLSKGNELFSILAGLLFEFAPFRLSGLSHLQNLCIFILPLAVLLILKFFDGRKKRYLFGLFLAMLYLCFGSWYQMVFATAGLVALLAGLVITKYVDWRRAVLVLGVALLAAACTLPVMYQYTQFSKHHQASFSVAEQVTYSSNVADYGMPNGGTIFGKVFYHYVTGTTTTTYNTDSVSYHGYIMYAVGIAVVITAWRWRKRDKDAKRNYQLVVALALVAIVGAIISFGPLLKIKGEYTYAAADNFHLVIPMPFAAVDVLVPQILFIRAIGRASVLVLFALCAFLALAPVYMNKSKLGPWKKRALIGLIFALMVFELMPNHRMLLNKKPYSYNLHIPAVYEYVKSHKEVDNIVILDADKDYPGAPIPIIRAENTLWAGYHNKNIFNGYSGYEPPTYMRDYNDFVDLQADDLPKMRKLGLRHVIIDKQLTTTQPDLPAKAASLFPTKLFEDSRYVLYRL